MSAGFVAVPVIPTFKGMSKEFAERLEKPAKASGERAGKAMSEGMESAVENLERQVKASSSKLQDLDRAYEKSASKQAAQKEKVEAATLKLQDAEEKYQSALESGDKGLAELAKVKEAKARLIGETEKLKQAEIDTRVAEEKHKNQLDDLNSTLGKLGDAQKENADVTDEYGRAVDSAGESSKNFEWSLGKVAVAAAAIGAAVGGAVKAAYDLGASFDDAYDTIRVGTGASGAAFEDLQDSLRNVAQDSIGVGSDLGEIGTTLADLNTRLGVTGEPLEKLTTQFQQLKGMGMEADVNAITGAFTQFGVEAEKAPDALDTLFQISQATGRGMDELVNNLTKSGPALQQFGFGLTESAGLLGALDKAGLDADKTMQSMTKALGEFAKDGEDPQQALWGMIEQIDELTRAGKSAEAVDLANSIFGARGGAGFVAAVESGAFAYDDFMESIGASGDTIGSVAEETADFAEVWDQFKLRAMLALEPVATAVFNALVPALEKLWDVGAKAGDILKGLFDFLRNNQSWLLPLGAALMTVAAGIAAMALQAKIMAAGGFIKWIIGATKATTAYSTATKIAAAAQKLFNTAIKGNFIGIAITAIMALVSALVVFFTKTEKGREMWSRLMESIRGSLDAAKRWFVDFADGVKAALQPLFDFFAMVKDSVGEVLKILFTGEVSGGNLFGLSEDATNLYVGYLLTLRDVAIAVWDGIKAAWDGLSTAIQWAWVNVIQPVWELLKAAAVVLFDVLTTVVFTPIKLAWEALSTTIQWTWENVIKPTWDALSAAATWLWESVLSPVFNGIKSAFQSVGESIQWVWESLIKPVWDALAAVVQWLWDTIFGPYLGFIRESFQALGDGFMWVWDNLLRPALDNFGGGTRDLWENTLAPTFQAIKDGFAAVGNAFRWVWDNVIRPAWDALGVGIRSVVDNAVIPAFDAIGNGLDKVKGWFRTAVDSIRSIWDGIRSATAKPVRFVVDTVYNKGIRKAWNLVAKFTGLDELSEIQLGDLGNFAQGGVLPGYTPGRDPYEFIEPRTGMRIGLSGGEAIMRPEWARMVGEKNISLMNSLAAQGRLTPEMVNTVQSPLPATYGDVTFGSDIPNPEAHHSVDKLNLVDAMRRDLNARVSHRFASGGLYTPTRREEQQLAGGIVNRSLWVAAKTAFPGATLNAAKSDHGNDGGYHPMGQAVDLGGPMQQMADWIFAKWPKTAQLIWGPGPLALWGKTGHIDPSDQAGIRAAYGPGTMAGHYNHVHWASDGVIDSDGVMISADGASAGGGFDVGAYVKQKWDDVIGKIGKWSGPGLIGELPGAMLKKMAGAAWDTVKEAVSKFASLFGGQGGQDGVRESWREMAMWAMRREGFNADDPRQVNAMLDQIMSESSGIANRNQEIVDINGTGASAGQGLLQVIPTTFADHRDPSLPNDRTNPEANMVAALRYYKWRYGTDLTTMWGHGHGYASGGVVELPKLYDQGGWLPHGGLAQNLSGKPEPVFTSGQWSSLSDMIRSLGDLVPAIKDQTMAIAQAVDNAEEWLRRAGNYNSIEGINARQGIRRVLDLGLDLPGTDVIKSVLDAEDTLWETRANAAKNLDAITEKEKALEEARRAVSELNEQPEGVSKEDQEKIDEAQKALDEAKAEQAKAESEEDRAKATDKVTEAEKKLKEVREEVDKNSEENAKKHAEEVVKANEAVSKAEQELADARKKQAMDLDNVVLASQSQIEGLIPQAKQLADQLIGMGAPAQAVNAGLAEVTGHIMRLASFAGPAGITLGMAMDMLKVGIGIIKAIVGAIEDLIAKIRKARLEALKALSDGWSVIADYAKLIVDLQGQVTTLQQALIRGANAQREAEYNLMLAQHDRYIAEAEGALRVAEARLALDAEIKRGATIAQLKLMGLHEDWDSYMAYQAMESQGVLEEWSNVAISSLFVYERARAEALKGELSARLEQIKAEAALAEAQRENVRNQQDLLTAQERLIRMSAKVAGVDLVEATGTAQVAKLMAEMAEVKQAMDKNTLGRWGAALGAKGSYANEYRGQQAQYESLQQALDAVLAETGVQIDRGNLDRVLKLMGRAAYRGGDPMAVLRAQLPELAQAETALKINESLKPVYDAQDQRDDLARQVEDFTAEIDLYEKTSPLEQTLKGLDYTIASLEQSSQAWAEGNEELRGEYLAAAKANRDAAEAAGVDWKLDSKYANAGVRSQIRRETTIHIDGEKMYTADQIDQILAEVTADTNGSYRIVRSASEVAVARRKERV